MLTQFCTQKKQYWAPTLENFELLSPKIGVFHIFMKCENTWEREKTEEKKEGGREKEREEEEGGRGEGRGRRRKGGEKECSRLKKKRVRAALAPSADSFFKRARAQYLGTNFRGSQKKVEKDRGGKAVLFWVGPFLDPTIDY